MGTDIYDNNGFTVTVFYGGAFLGQCLQISTREAYVKIPLSDFRKMVNAAMAHESKTRLSNVDSPFIPPIPGMVKPQ